MPDIYSYEFVEALRRRGCPVCRVAALDEGRRIDTFWREGRLAPEARRGFLASGGFCRSHAWLLHRQVAAEGAGAAMADVYGLLAEQDLELLAHVRERLDERKPRRRGMANPLARRRPCLVCGWLADALPRKAGFVVEALSEEPVRERYTGSDGLCFDHLALVAEDPDIDVRHAARTVHESRERP